ncbi:hypothetical protein LEMLEM_LOCUS3454 [Lemmus lemmus]
MDDSSRYLEGDTLEKGRALGFDVVCLGGDRKTTPGAGHSHRGPDAGYGALRTRVRLPGLRPAGPLGRSWFFHKRLAAFLPPTYSVRGCTTGSRHEFVLFCCVRSLAGWLTRSGMSSGAGMAPQSNVAMSPIHLPALSPRRQLLTNGKPQFPASQARGMAASLTVKPKQQEFADPFSPNPEKGEDATWVFRNLCPSSAALLSHCGSPLGYALDRTSDESVQDFLEGLSHDKFDGQKSW